MSNINGARKLQILYFNMKNKKTKNLKNGEKKVARYRHLYILLMVCRLIDLAPVVPKLLMFKICGIIGVTKIEFCNISSTERVYRHVY